MRRIAFVLVAAACAGRAPSPASPPYPPARRDNVRETLHGVDIVDPYRWLEDQNSPETRAFIDAENAYARALLDPFPGRARILDRLTALSRVDAQSVPSEHGGRYFVGRRRAQDELTILYVRTGLRGEDRVLLDPHPLSRDHTTSVGFEAITRDGRRVLYFVRRGGEDESELRVRDVDGGRDLPDVLPRALYRGASWDRRRRRLLLRAPGPQARHSHPPPRAGHAGRGRRRGVRGGLRTGAVGLRRRVRERTLARLRRRSPGVRYPAVLFVTGDADTRVPPLQARKMTARMQAATAGGRPILLLYDTKAGHSGGKPLGKFLEDLALEVSFLARELGIDPVTATASP